MTVRSIKLKMMTKASEKEHAANLRKALWGTHRLLNEGVAYYLEWLLCLRQQAVNEQHSEAEYQVELLNRIREQQEKNGWEGQPVPVEEIFTTMRQLYTLMVPTADGGTGDAQQLARAFLSPLTDPDSKGGEGTSNAGNKPRWKRMQEEGDPNWELERDKAMAKKEADPTKYILQKLREWGLKPLIPLYTDQKKDINWIPKQKKQFVRTWDRDMFQQAIERMLSWESWNRRIAEEGSKLQQSIADVMTKFFGTEEDELWLMEMQTYERERGLEIEKDSFAPKDRYRITSRQIRGWERISAKWLRLFKDDITDNQAYWDVVAEYQTDHPKEFGDPKVYLYLSKIENRHLWTDKPERLRYLAVLNRLLIKHTKAKTTANFTHPDAIRHPLWVRYDARGGNLHSYVLTANDPDKHKHMSVSLERLLWPEGNGWTERKGITIELATSRQFWRQIRLTPSLDNPKGKQTLRFMDYSSRLELSGTLGGAKLQFDRRHLELKQQTLTEGNIGSVYFNLTVDVEPLQAMRNNRVNTPVGKLFRMNTKDWPKIISYKPAELEQWMEQTEEGGPMGPESIAQGLRVMSVDLGQRTSAAVSVFEVVKTKPSGDKLHVPVHQTGLYAVHRRSVLLKLPGEDATPEVESKRRERNEAMYAIRLQVRQLAGILRLAGHTDLQKREAMLEKLMEIITGTDRWEAPLKSSWLEQLDQLKGEIRGSEEQWNEAVIRIHRLLEKEVGHAFSEWRRSLTRERHGLAGLSMWSLEELENTRKLLVSWSKRSRLPAQQLKRPPSDEKFASRLLRHMQAVRNDRLKQAANLIVMTALGYVYDERAKKWVAAYPACQAVLFEDLGRYLFRLDRSRSENSRLMKWSHRSIPREVHMQGQLFGLLVGDVSSEYSSRFHAKTGSPGIRCHAVTKDDLEDRSSVLKRLDKAFMPEKDLGRLKPGDLIPMAGGELFVSFGKKNGARLTQIHADLNAAQNLQKRFWQQLSEPYRAACRFAGDGVYVPKSKRIRGIMGKGAFVEEKEPLFKLEVYKWRESTRLVSRIRSADQPDEVELSEEWTEDIEQADELRGEHKTLFKDAGGYFFPSDFWIPQVEYWSVVKNKLYATLRDSLQSNPVKS